MRPLIPYPVRGVLTVAMLREAMDRLMVEPAPDGHYCEGWWMCANMDRILGTRICQELGYGCPELQFEDKSPCLSG